MKKLIGILGLLGMIISTISCLNDEPIEQVHYNYKAIDSIQIEEIRSIGEITEIKTFFTASKSCEKFFDFEYIISNQERIVSLIVSELKSENCEDSLVVKSEVLEFRPERRGKYLFKFWSGTNENNKATYITKELEIF